jgi:hypothetical protein
MDSGRMDEKAAGGVMVLSGRRHGVGRVRLHDLPPGYRPPRKSSWYLWVNARHARVIVCVAAVVLVLAAAAVAVMILLMIAGYR